METGFDILFFWVARMMMMGIHFMGEVPFETVLLHGMVRDEHGQKMSKTKGNVIDPLDILPELGADSLRFTLAGLAGQPRDIKLSTKYVEKSRNFINKIWNASRFALMNLGDFDPNAAPPERLGMVDRWILSRLDATIAEVDRALMALTIDKAADALYDFFWSEFCDWYIELAKPVLYGDAGAEEKRATQWTLVQVLDAALRLLHPFIPFATEEIWQTLPLAEGRPAFLMTADFPKAGAFTRDADAEAEVGLLIEVITGVRNIRGELGLTTAATPEITVLAPDAATLAALESQRSRLERLARIERLVLRTAEGEKPAGTAVAVAGKAEVHVPVVGLIDIQAELARLDKALTKAGGGLEGIRKKLGNPDFVARAPEEIIEKERDREAELVDEIARLTASRARLAEISA
jgi:valyl-tRNA synthetase